MRLGLAALFLTPLLCHGGSGDATCMPCHNQETAHFRVTPMGKALETAAECEILKGHPLLQYQEGAYHTEIKRDGDRSVLTVTRGKETFTVPILWAFGQGQAGQTYVFEYDGAMFESRASFYVAAGALDTTIGALGTAPKDIVEAAGRRMDAAGARSCFGCHSNNGVSGGKLVMEALVPGVGCQSCHGAVEKHANAVLAGDVKGAALPRLNDLSPEDMANLCGKCHRTWASIAEGGPLGPNNVRFQPYRLANSKCYDVDDRRIRCTACHDPHEPLNTNLASYDGKCTACHATSLHTRTCPVGKTRCVECHMPKIALPGAHSRFTDHQIRIARPGEPYPN